MNSLYAAANMNTMLLTILDITGGKYEYSLSILKSDDGNPENTLRFTYTYDNPQKGEGHYIHTYMGDGNPLPSFEGEPVKLGINGNIDELTNTIWGALNEENKVSLFVRFIELATGKYEERIVNKNK